MSTPMNLWRAKNGSYYLWISRTEAPPDGKRVSLKKVVGYTVTDPAEAGEILKALQKNWHQKKIIELDQGKRISLSKFTEEYTDSRADKSPSTLRADALALKLLAEVIGDSINVGAIRTKHISDFKTACLARKIRSASLNTYLRHIRAAFTVAMEWEYMTQKPVIKSVQEPKRRVRILTSDEISAIVKHSSENDPDFARVILFALWTGSRRAEIRRLCWTDITENTARIIGKGDRERSVPLLPSAVKAMGTPKDIGPVFPQCHIDRYSRRFRSIADECELPDIKFHTLRHSAASYMIQSGMNPKVVQKILGHQDFRTTEIYIHLNDDFVTSEMEKFGKRSRGLLRV